MSARTDDRVVRPFEWGMDWVPAAALGAWAAAVMNDTDRFYGVPHTGDFRFDGRRLTFPSALETRHAENNTVHARYFPADTPRRARRRAVVVLPQWNAGPEDHMALAGLLARFGISALRLSLP